MYWAGGNFIHIKNSEVYRHILTLDLGINNGDVEDGDDLVNLLKALGYLGQR